MNRSLSQFLSDYIFPIVALLLLLGISIVFWINFQENQKVSQRVAVEDAHSFSISVAEFRNFYTKRILPSLRKRNVPITHDFLAHPDGAAPLPATFAKEFGRFLSKDKGGYKVRLYSDLPFSWSQDSAQLDAFETAAMIALRVDPNQPFWRIEHQDGKDVLRYARADILKPSCVACHNAYPGTPKTDWKAGDVRGVLEIQRPLNYESVSSAQAWRSFMMMVALALFTLLLLAIMMHRLRYSLRQTQQLLSEKSNANERLNEEAEQRTKLTEKLVINQNKTRAVMNSVKDVIIVIDPKGTVIEVNQAIEEMFGFKMEEVLDQNIKMLMPDPYQSEHDGCFATYMKTRKQSIIGRTRRVNGQRKDGKTFIFDLSVTEVQLNETTLFTGVIRDMTEQVAAEEAMQKARDEAIQSAKLKSEFLANMSHEIRTPMNGVIGMTNLLLDTPLNKEQRALAETVSSSASSLLQIINDILDFSKIEAGKLEVQLECRPLLTTLEDAIMIVADSAYEKGLRFGYFIDPTLPAEVHIDSTRIGQVLVNLLGNAVKFTEEGFVILRVELYNDKAGERHLRFCVSDSGIGIPEEAQERLFEAFSQVDGSTTRNYGGTGLGLSISQQLVTLMHGEMGLESEVGVGSTFYFTVPLLPNTDEPCLAPLDTSTEVLVLFDDEQIGLALEKQLQGLNIELSLYASLEAFLDRLNALEDEMTLIAVDVSTLERQEAENGATEKMSQLIATGRSMVWFMSRQQHQNKAYQPYVTEPNVFVMMNPLSLSLLHKKIQLLQNGEMDETETSLELSSGEAENDSLQNQTEMAFEDDAFRILLVEDNLVNQKLALALLAKMGYEADLAENGAVALDKLQSQSYDLVLMDCQMPVKDGYEATRELRQWDNEVKNIPIIAMTANAMKGDDDKCYAAGMNDYMTKPINPQTLAEKIDYYVQKKAQDTSKV